MRVTPEWYADRLKGRALPAPPKKSKFGAILTTYNQIKFQSKKEARYYMDLQARVHAKEVRYFLRQVPFDLPGGVKYRIDFMEVWADGSIHWIDVKGFRTETYRIKRRQVEALYPIKIEEV